MNGWDYFWLGWLAIFAVGEGIALTRSDKDDTLSEKVWKWFSVTERNRGRFGQARRFALLAFMAWLSAHFMTGGWI